MTMRDGLPYADRIDAGRRLARHTSHLAGRDLVVVGLPRGGIPVAAEVADALEAPLDVIVVRKLGLPWQPELAMGAIGEGGIRVVSDDLVARAGVSEQEFAAVEHRERTELERRASRYRPAGEQRIDVAGRTVVVVDDGIATGATARAACLVVRAAGASAVVLATPVAPVDWHDGLDDVADDLVAAATPSPFGAIGRFYRDFSPTTDDEVLACLRRAAHRRPAGEP